MYGILYSPGCHAAFSQGQHSQLRLLPQHPDPKRRHAALFYSNKSQSNNQCDLQVSALTNVSLPLIRGFRNDILQNPLILDAIHIVTQSPMLQDYFTGIGNFTGDLAPIIRAYTVRPSWHALCRGK